MELAEKTPEICKLQEQLQEIAKGQRKEISASVINDAFDAMEIIVQKVCNTLEEVAKVQKLVCCNLVYRMITNQNVYIRN